MATFFYREILSFFRSNLRQIYHAYYISLQSPLKIYFYRLIFSSSHIDTTLHTIMRDLPSKGGEKTTQREMSLPETMKITPATKRQRLGRGRPR